MKSVKEVTAEIVLAGQSLGSYSKEFRILVKTYLKEFEKSIRNDEKQKRSK